MLSPVATVLLAALSAGPEAADPAFFQARAHIEAGKKLQRLGRYADAVAEFLAAQKLKPQGYLWFNVARCHELMGDIPRALFRYRLYLHDEPAAIDRSRVEVTIAEMEGTLRARGLFQLLVLSTPAGAAASVAGATAGSTPAAIELRPGRHSLSLSLPGYAPASRTVVVGNRSELIDVALALAPAPPPGPAIAPEVVVDVSGLAAPGPEVTEPPAAAPARRPWPYLAGGLGVASLAAGIGLGLASSSARSELLGSEHGREEAGRLYGRASGFATGANVAYGMALLSGAAAVYFYVMGPKGEPPARPGLSVAF